MVQQRMIAAVTSLHHCLGFGRYLSWNLGTANEHLDQRLYLYTITWWLSMSGLTTHVAAGATTIQPQQIMQQSKPRGPTVSPLNIVSLKPPEMHLPAHCCHIQGIQRIQNTLPPQQLSQRPPTIDAISLMEPWCLQVLEWTQQILRIGEAFSGAECTSLREVLARQSGKFFDAFHDANLQVR